MSTTIRHPGDIHRHYSHLGEQPLLTPDEGVVGEGAEAPQGVKKGVKWSRELEEVKPIPTRQKEKEEARTITPTPLSVGNQGASPSCTVFATDTSDSYALCVY